MISCRRSSAQRKNPALVEQRRANRPSVARALPRLLRKGEPVDGTLVLIGGTDLLHFQMRVAQSHLRHDMTPSYWSHVAVAMRCDTGLELHEVAIDPPGGFADMPALNGIHTVSLDRYDDRNRFPNLAVLRFPIEESPGETVCDAILKVQRERGLLDLTTLVLPWLGYAWGAGLPANPLLSGNGIPSAAFAEAVFAALGVELTPGLATKASCPEAIWQAARWWHQYYEKPLPPELEEGRQVAKPRGLYWVGQRHACLREF
ncbi:MAG: hypothetical protein E8D45_07090 [Nitrospira sp.]|nr:MAG: hypothetical protein E8D45_07090 [Nitrospira sp.]